MSGDPYSKKPWLGQYSTGLAGQISPKYETILAAFLSAVKEKPSATAIHYYDGALTYLQLDDASDKLAKSLLNSGFGVGDRLGLCLQNNPAFVIGMLAAWKAGGAVVALSPMYKARELRHLLCDSGVRAILCLDDIYNDVIKPVLENNDLDISLVVIASASDYKAVIDDRVEASAWQCSKTPKTETLQNIVSSEAEDAFLPLRAPSADDLALLVYTSGATGKPKGAMLTHGNLRFAAQAYQEWVGLTPDDLILGIAPLFHVTGIVGHVALSLITACPLILMHRFTPEVVIETIREKRPTFTIGAITAFMSLMQVRGANRSDFTSFRAVYTGGAPVSPATAQSFEDFSGIYLYNAFGMTETCSPTHLVPLGSRAPVDEATGAISIGVPIFNTCVRVIDDEGRVAKPGDLGEIVDCGPQVMKGYWQQPQATTEAVRDGWLCTGDVGFMDEQGWFYLLDRKKDMIVVSGYKVWPREVEDVLYSHPAVREAVVIGIADEYCGEVVKAVVSLQPGANPSVEDLILFCKDNLAAYKYPRVLEVVHDLPKSASGKLLRSGVRNTEN